MNNEWSQIAANAICHSAEMAQEIIRQTAFTFERPSVQYRPALYKDGAAWCALYGRDIMEGVCGFGDTPAEAMDAFDKAWVTR